MWNSEFNFQASFKRGSIRSEWNEKILKDLSKYFWSCKNIQGKFWGKSTNWFLFCKTWLFLLCLLRKPHLQINFILFDTVCWINNDICLNSCIEPYVLFYVSNKNGERYKTNKNKNQKSKNIDQDTIHVTFLILQNNWNSREVTYFLKKI